MGTPIEQPGNDEVQGGNPDAGDNTPGPNPAWEPVLSVLPEQFHSVVTPHFQKWDQSAQERIESVNTQLKAFEGYNKFTEHGITADEVEQGLRLMYEINNNPQSVFDALKEAYKFGENPTPVANDEEDGDNPLAQLPPEVMAQLSQHDDLLKTVSQIVLNDANAKQAAVADNALEKELSDLKEKHGEYDEEFVLTKMLNGASAEDAVKSYQDLVQRVTPKPFAPSVLGGGNGGGGIPSNAIDPTKLSRTDTKSLVAQMLEQAARQQ